MKCSVLLFLNLKEVFDHMKIIVSMYLKQIHHCFLLLARFKFILVFVLISSCFASLHSSELATPSNSTSLFMPPPVLGCNDPIVGKGAVVDQLAGSLVSALSGSSDSEVIVDGDLTNFLAFNGTDLIGVGAISLVSVKDVNNTYPAGQRTGFVISAEGGLIGADVLNDLEIRTYLNNQLQETAQVGGGGAPISLALLAGPGSKRRVDFLTTLPFDEVELRLSGVANLSLISALRVYYAYEEVDGCDYNCATALTTTNYPSSTASTNCELFAVVCLDDGFNNFSNTTNADTIDYAEDDFLLAESNYLDIDIGEDIPANYEVGFAVEQIGLLGLLSLDVLGGITIQTYDNGSPVETFVANNSLANVGVLVGDINLISFPTTQVFDQVRITISSVLSLLTTYRIYYGFIRPDTDGDGFPDCVDQCAGGDDNFDADGDGIPDFCDNDCMVDAGIDASACTSSMTFTLSPAGVGETWTPVMGNPSAASIDAAGVITGLDMEGYYLFELSNGSCSDTITIAYFASQGPLECNDPIVGPGVVINDNGSCSNCGNADVDNVVDGDLSNFTEESSLLSLSLLGGDTRLIAVKDTLQEYPGGLRTGFVLNFPSGLLSLDLLDVFALQTYNNGVLVELAGNGSSNLLNLDGLAANGQQRLSFVTTLPFDEVELVIQGGLASLDLLTTTRIFYAFTEPTSCPDASTITDITDLCGIPLTASSDYCGGIVYERSGFTGLACVGCSIDSLSNLIDHDLTQPTTIDLLVAALGDVSLSVATTNVVNAGSIAGFAIDVAPSLLDVGLLGNISLTTYLAGSPQESVVASNPLVSASLLNNGSDITYLSFATTLDFDEVQITFDAGLAAVSAIGGTISVYYAYIQADSDGDGTPDCLDKCCEGPDTLDADGDGLPDACDSEVTTTLALRAYLLGALWPDFSGDNLMRDDLRSLGYLPLDQPYSAAVNARFEHFGGGGTEQTTMPVISANAGTGDAVVDWVFIELRDATDSTIVFRTISAVIQRDGDVVAADGGPLQLAGLPSSFFIAIKHRNHLGVMTAAPVIVSGQAASVDFTTISTADLYNQPGYDGFELYTLGNGKKALWASNANADFKVKYDGSANDRQKILQEVITFPGNLLDELNYNNAVGYFAGDCNMNGKAKYDGADNDRTIIQAVVVSLYDLNTGQVNNFNNMIEQVPPVLVP